MVADTDSNKRIAKNSFFMSMRMVLVLVITLYTSRIILESLGVEDYGIYNVVAGFVTMFGFLNTSLSNGIQRFYNFELGKTNIEGVNRVYNVSLLIQLILSIVVVVPAEILGTWYLHNKMVIPVDRLFAAECVFHLSIVAFIFNILQVPYSAAVMAHERMDFYALMSILNALMTLGCAFIIPLYAGDHLIFYGFFIALISFIFLLIYIIYARRNFKEIYLNFKFQRQLFKEILSFSGWNVFGTLGHMLKDQGVNLILNLFFGPVINAARAIAIQVNNGLQSFVSNITVPVRPQVIQSYSRGDISRSLKLTFSISKLSCYFLLFVALPIILEIEYVLKIWLGSSIPKYTSIFIVIIILNSFLNNLNSAVSGIVHASGKMKVYQLSGGVISILSVIFVYISMTFWDIPSIAFIVVLGCDVVRQIVALMVLKTIVKEFSLKDYFYNVVIPLILVVIVSSPLPVIAHLLMPVGLLRFCIVLITSTTSVIISIYIIGLNMSEKALVNKMLRNVTKVFYI